MSAPTNHFKMGLFVLGALAAATGTAVAFGAASVKNQTVTYHTFFNESVQGLDVGAPVKYRGVPIGVVSGINVAPDRRHVDVAADLDVEDLERLGLAEGEGMKRNFIVPDDLRSQLGSQGITGVKFVALDFFDVNTNPAPDLPFDPPPNTIPAAASLMKTLEDSIVQAVDQLPEVAASVRASLEKIEIILEDVRQKEVPERIARTLDEAAGALADVRVVLKRFDDSRVPQKAGKALDNLDTAVTKLNRVLDRVDGDDGLVASAQRTTDEFGEVGRSAHGTAAELEHTLRDVGEAAQALRDLMRELEKDPAMLVKGRSSRSEK
jgi:phospholipid/cholesterol/gamma-HCH transport system substrate-binding protein